MMSEEKDVSHETVEDADDIFVENFNTALLLFLGILAVFASVALFARSAILVFYGQLLAISLLTNSIFGAFLLVVGLGSLHLFRKRRRLRREKTSSVFYRAR